MEAKIAYFSAEFGIHESLPIYSGGLGVLAGDYVKACDDLRIPLLGIGILYRRGYFQQRILPDGRQEALYPQLRPEELPLHLVLQADGNPLLIDIPMANRTVYLKLWCVDVGSVPIYLMDADIENNLEIDRRLTDQLYGGGQDERIRQEIILGIGGVRALRALGMEPNVWHMNEGHVAFLTLERIREYSEQGLPFEAAVEAVKASTVFTTHTPVPAGHDVYDVSLIDDYLGNLYWQLGANRERILALGQVGNQFNMTRLAVNTSSKVNGVSGLHGQVSRELFHQWLPQIPAQDISVLTITNGIHTRTWLAPEFAELFNRYLELDWSDRLAEREVWEDVSTIPDSQLWQAHQQAKRRMLDRIHQPIHENTLVVGFARRFATYKRATLLLRDLDRLDRILNHPERPVRIVFAGKAHPNDRPGQDLIRQILEVSKTERFRGRICFVENYDLEIAKHLVQGVDVWLNTPVKPMEASGTSGQKAGLNGVLNCSILDGWWREGYNGKNGWAIEGSGAKDPDVRDGIDGDELYHLLEHVIAVRYYQRNEQSLPHQWVAMMKESIQSIGPEFCTSRMAAEYYDKLYLPVLNRGTRFQENHYEVARRVADYKRFIRRAWSNVRITKVHEAENPTGVTSPENHVWTVQALVRLGPIWHCDVRVQAVGSDGCGGIWRLELELAEERERGVYLYRGIFPGTLDSWWRDNANLRVFPVSPDFANEFELELTTWATNK